MITVNVIAAPLALHVLQSCMCCKKLCDWFQSTAWFPATEQDTLLAVARWTAALTPVLKLRCRWQTDVRKELQASPCAALWHAVLCYAVLQLAGFARAE